MKNIIKKVIDWFIEWLLTLCLLAYTASLLMDGIIQYGWWGLLVIPGVIAFAIILTTGIICFISYLRYVITHGRLSGFNEYLRNRSEGEKKDV
jgi:hypothetical protein